MSTICPPIDVTKLPYARRQLIIVQPDLVVVAAREAEANAAAQSGDTDWVDVAGRVAKAMLGMRSIYGMAFELATEALKAWAKARESGLDVLQIGHSEATALQFPPGHPREQAMYVAHPAVPTVYYTAAAFHRMAFEHKFSEAIRLLMSLGASHIVVEHVHGWSSEFSANLSAGLPQGEGGVSGGRKESASSKLLFDAVLKNKKAPTLPAGLVWYLHEPTWQAVAAGRLEYGMQQFSLNVVYDDDFGVNAGLKMRAQKAGLEIGGAFEDHMATTWKIHGKFVADEG
ncbi:MAG: hypothetical protein Q7K57_45235 [Burkholderiaceae bacterium]|nr:hypothetical protein [Burkholderiaceae bacterium]